MTLLAALLIAGAMNFFMYYGSSKMVLRMYRAQVVTAAEAPELYAMVDRLRQRAGLPMPTATPLELAAAFDDMRSRLGEGVSDPERRRTASRTRAGTASPSSRTPAARRRWTRWTSAR